MDRQKVNSSIISSVGHEKETLEVEFNTGKVYTYPNVSKQTYEQMLNSDSVGRFFKARIQGVRNKGYGNDRNKL